MSDFPPPLTPPDCDLSDFGFMPLDVVRFRNSDLVAFETSEAVLAAVMLWGVSWHATPAASLTNDDRALAQAAGYGRAVGEWLKVKEGALRGFILCSDNRLYHPVVAEKAMDAWNAKLRRIWSVHCAALRKRNERLAPDEEKHVTPSFDDWLVTREKERSHKDSAPMSRVTDPNVTRDLAGAHEKGRDREGTGKGQGHPNGSEDPLPRAPVASRLPNEWKPRTLDRKTVSGSIAEARGQEWMRRAFETFENHWRSKSGKDAVKQDWQATWANWVIEQDRRDQRNGIPRRNDSEDGSDPLVAAYNRALADEEAERRAQADHP